MHFESFDRLPRTEYAPWWDLTIKRWRGEGMPAFPDLYAERAFFGLDPYCYWYITPYQGESFNYTDYGQGGVTNMDLYRRVRPSLFPENPFPAGWLTMWKERKAKGEMVVWYTALGFFSFPRSMFGIEPHLYAFYDHPETIHEMCRDALAYNLRTLDLCLKHVKPDFLAFFEDMSYNHGPMCSEAHFEEFIAPYYRQITARLRELDIIPMVDSDGQISDMIPWFARAGIDGFFPLERQAGVDITALRKQYPRLRLFGAYDKMVMKFGEAAMRREFERILPVMKQGGYIPCVDHQTPPDVSLENYKTYVGLLKEYCRKAGTAS